MRGKSLIFNAVSKGLVSTLAKYLGESDLELVQDDGFDFLDELAAKKINDTYGCPLHPLQRIPPVIVTHPATPELFGITINLEGKISGVYRLFKKEYYYPRVSDGRKLAALELMKHPDPKEGVSFYDVGHYEGGNLGVWIVSAVKTSSIGIMTYLTSGLSPIALEITHEAPGVGDGQIFSMRRLSTPTAYSVKVYIGEGKKPAQEFSIIFPNTEQIKAFKIRASNEGMGFCDEVNLPLLEQNQIEIKLPAGYGRDGRADRTKVRKYLNTLFW